MNFIGKLLCIGQSFHTVGCRVEVVSSVLLLAMGVWVGDGDAGIADVPPQPQPQSTVPPLLALTMTQFVFDCSFLWNRYVLWTYSFDLFLFAAVVVVVVQALSQVPATTTLADELLRVPRLHHHDRPHTMDADGIAVESVEAGLPCAEQTCCSCSRRWSKTSWYYRCGRVSCWVAGTAAVARCCWIGRVGGDGCGVQQPLRLWGIVCTE